MNEKLHSPPRSNRRPSPVSALRRDGHDAYRVTEDDDASKKFYACSMLPYPSGKLHMGHVRNYTINDMLARQLRMKGMNVLMPMGWDAFGLPAENAAMKNKVPPAKWTYDNIAHMKGQMQAMGLAIDWSREVATCSPEYYKWNQWLFLKMLEAGIAERRTQVVNWDPVDQTVLANEQVIDGRGWRSGALIEKREIPGYYLKITQYAEELLEQVQHAPARLARAREADAGELDRQERGRALRLPARHPRRRRRADPGRAAVRLHDPRRHHHGRDLLRRGARAPAGHACGEAQRRSSPPSSTKCKAGGTTEAELATQEKKGVPTGLMVDAPAHRHETVPVWVGNYVLMSYGDGAVMGVPAHDERDFAFAKKYGIDDPAGGRTSTASTSATTTGRTGTPTSSAASPSTPTSTAAWRYRRGGRRDRRRRWRHKGLGEKKTTWRLRDWGISRQRYWGTPIPIIHCDELRRGAGAREGPAGRAARRPDPRRQRQPAATSARPS